MSIITRSLSGEMLTYDQAGHHVAVLLIDEQDYVPLNYLIAQRQVLHTAKRQNIPIWQIELNPEINGAAPAPNRPTHSSLVIPGAKVLSKPHLNAFASNAHPNLHQQLQRNGISILVVMGYNVNCCVRATSVGGADDRRGKLHRPGATQLGYTVLSCDHVLRGGQATWKQERGVRFYTAL